MSAPAPIIEGRDLAISIDGRWIIPALDVSFSAGELTVLIGPNGAGKTTLIRALAGLLPAWGRLSVGGVPYDNLDPRTRARAIAYLPQGHAFHWPMEVGDVVALGRVPHGAGTGSLSERDREAVLAAMAATGTTRFLGRPVTSLSGGERARVALARVLSVQAAVVLADEPTASLDPRYQLVVLEMLRRQADAGVAVIAVLHDLGLASRFADRLVVLNEGKIVADGTPDAVLTEEMLAGIFGISAAFADHDGVRIVVPWSATGSAEAGED